MKELLCWGAVILGVMAIDIFTGIEPEPEKPKRGRKSSAEPKTVRRLQKSLYGPGKYDGPGCWRRGEGYTG